MKKMKKIVPLESPPPRAVYEDQRIRYNNRHQSLLQDYEELHKEMEIMRRKLQIMKQKKLMLSSEVRFFRKRYRYLKENASAPKPQPKQDYFSQQQQQKLKIQAPIISKSRNFNKKESNLRPRVASHPKERISNGVDVKSQKSAHVFDLNQNARTSSGKDASFLSSAPLLDWNKKDRIHNGKEATKKNTMPRFFDLNQISREEEELLGDIEPTKMEEPKRSTQRGASDEQHGDFKLSVSVCRNAGNGSNRTGKRKISWQDQVALRV